MLASRQYGDNTAAAAIAEFAPHSIEAEQAVIGSLLADASQWESVSDRLSAGDFYQVEHKHIYEALARLNGAGEAVDPVTLANQLTIAGVLERCGGMMYLVSLQTEHSVVGVIEHADIVRERSTLRRLRSLGQAVTRAVSDAKLPRSTELIEQLESGLLEIQTGNRTEKGYSFVGDYVPNFIDELDRRSATGNLVTGIATGFPALDCKLCGLQRSDLIIVAGRPSMGKTTLAMNIAENAALREGQTVAVFSLEMSRDQLMNRLMSSVGGVDAQRMRTGRLEESDWPKVSAAAAEIRKARIIIDDTTGLTPSELRTRARRMKREEDISLIVVDYLQLMQGDGRAENRTNEVSDISRKLKALAKELNLPLIALSQLNRTLEQRHDKRPVNADLRDSGAIEQDADVILFVYRDEVYNPESTSRGIAEVIIGKQRNGPIGEVLLSFQGQYNRFTNPTAAGHHYV